MSAFSSRLPNRTVVRVTGQDPHGFLQGLFCNDLRNLTSGGSLYGCFLNKAGRVVADAILMQSLKEHEGHKAVYLDVDRSMSAEIVQHLMEFKLRRKVKVEDLTGKVGVMAVRDDVGSTAPPVLGEGSAAEVFPDPRALYLRDDLTTDNASPISLRRAVFPSTTTLPGLTPTDYDHLLISNGLFEGPTVFTKEKSLPFESNLDMLNGVSFHKGCYLGQELTHRTHVMLVTRKRTVPLILGDHFNERAHVPLDATASPLSWGAVGGSIFSEDGAKIGVLQAVAHNKAIGLLRLRYFDPVAKKMRVKLDNGAVATASIPHWWEEETIHKIFSSSSSQES